MSTVISPESRAHAADVVVIDDEESMCEGCRQALEMDGYRTEVAMDGTEGLKLVEERLPSVVLVDLKMPGISGTEVLGRLASVSPGTVPIVITGYGSIDTAVESMKLGAFDFLTKPFEPDRLLDTVKRGMRLSQAREQATLLEERPPSEAPVAEPAPAAPVAVPLRKEDVLLKGLEALGEGYALGLEQRTFFQELRYLESEARYHAQSLGQVKKKERAILDILRDLRLVDETIARHDYQKSALIQVLLDVQAQLHWLPRHAMRWVAARLRVPLAQIYRIASFYEALSLEPRGEHLVQVCEGTACHVRGAKQLLGRVTHELGIQPGHTDGDQRYTLESVRCVGCCALAPVMKVDDKFYPNPSLRTLRKLLGKPAGRE